MDRIVKTGLLLSFFYLIATSVNAQDEWNVPWTNVGDSLDLVEDEEVHITGVITNVDTNEPISGASISVELFKHFDFSDKKGAYFLELLPGTYKVKIKHVGMLPVYKRLRVI